MEFINSERNAHLRMNQTEEKERGNKEGENLRKNEKITHEDMRSRHTDTQAN